MTQEDEIKSFVIITLAAMLILSVILIGLIERPNGTYEYKGDSCNYFSSYKGSNTLSDCDSGNTYHDVQGIKRTRGNNYD